MQCSRVSAPAADELARQQSDEAAKPKAEKRKSGETKRRGDVIMRHDRGPQRARQVWSTASEEEMHARLTDEFKPSTDREWELETHENQGNPQGYEVGRDWTYVLKAVPTAEEQVEEQTRRAKEEYEAMKLRE
jgi:hypothetical protein